MPIAFRLNLQQISPTMVSRSPAISIILSVAFIVFSTSLWHLKPWNSFDMSLTQHTSVTPPSWAPTGPLSPQGPPAAIPPQIDVATTEIEPPPKPEDNIKKKPESKAKPKPASPPSIKEPTFYEVALKHGTDKVTTHSYHKMYQKYLGPIRTKPIKMLEIGLGCDMNYGPGKSYYTWLEWLPNVDLYYLEYDAECATKWAKETSGATVVAGDQADVPFLQKFMDKYGRDFDIIIDDGGHTMIQQRTSLDNLYDAIKPGGIYFCEDLQTSYMEKYGGTFRAGHTMVEYIKTFLDDLHMRGRMGTPDNKDIMSIDCMNEKSKDRQDVDFH